MTGSNNRTSKPRSRADARHAALLAMHLPLPAQDKKAAPMVLIGLVCFGILLPLVVASWYMLSSSKFTGPVMQVGIGEGAPAR